MAGEGRDVAGWAGEVCGLRVSRRVVGDDAWQGMHGGTDWKETEAMQSDNGEAG